MARVICPACKTPGNVPDQFLGNRIRCPSCGERFTAPTLPPPANAMTRTATAPPAEKAVAVEVMPASQPPPLVARVQASPPEVQVSQKKVCLYCGEEIQAVALKCKHCGEILDPVLRAAEEAKAVARQQTSSPNINVSTAVSNVIGGYARPRRGLSRLIPVGVLLFFVGMVGMLSSSTPSPLMGLLVGLGIIVMGIGAVVTLIHWFMAMFR